MFEAGSVTPVAARGDKSRNPRGAPSVPHLEMTSPTEHTVEISELLALAGRRVRVRLDDDSEHVGELRTELLSDRSISVFLRRSEQEGATIYIDDIVGIWPIS
jgi:hypothetical protein